MQGHKALRQWSDGHRSVHRERRGHALGEVRRVVGPRDDHLVVQTPTASAVNVNSPAAAEVGVGSTIHSPSTTITSAATAVSDGSSVPTSDGSSTPP